MEALIMDEITQEFDEATDTLITTITTAEGDTEVLLECAELETLCAA